MTLELRLENAGKSFLKQWLFKGVTQRWLADKGKSLAILGANGSGKSTMTLMMAGQLVPSEGSCMWFSGQQEWSTPLGHLALSSPALELPEEWTLTEWFDFQNKVLPFRKGHDLNKFIADCQYNKKVAKKPISTFSSGMKQRVKLALALWADVPLSIVDEPLTNLDKQGEELYRLWATECLDHQSIIVASNRQEEYFFCDEHWQITPEGLVVTAGS
jgi:ABC-type multidrug transport system ATPase subunit